MYSIRDYSPVHVPIRKRGYPDSKEECLFSNPAEMESLVSINTFSPVDGRLFTISQPTSTDRVPSRKAESPNENVRDP